MIDDDDDDDRTWNWGTDKDLTVTSISSRFFEYFGRRAAAEVLGKKLWEVFGNPQDPGIYDQPLQEAVKEKRSFRNFAFSFKRLGREATMTVTGEATVDEKGAFVGYKGVGRPAAAGVTDKMRIPPALLPIMSDTLPAGVALFGQGKVLLGANERFRQLFPEALTRIFPGLRYREFLNLPVQKRTPDFADAMHKAVEAYNKDGTFELAPDKGPRVRCRFLSAGDYKMLFALDVEDEHRTLETLRSQLASVSDRLRRNDDLIRKTGIDFENKVQADMAARIALLREEYKRLYSSEISCILRVNEDGTIRSASPALCRMLGFVHESELRQVLKNVAQDLYVTPQARIDIEHECRENGTLRDQIVSWKHLGSGSVLVVGETVQSVFRDGVFQYYESHAVDLTDRQRMAAQLERAGIEHQNEQQSKAQFLYHMSHEMRTPLNAVIGFADMLIFRARSEGKGEYLEPLQDIREAGRSLLGIVEDMLLLLSLSKSDYALHDARFDPKETVLKVCSDMREPAERKNIELSVRIVSDCPDLYADGEIVGQCLRRILDNAVRFTPHNGRIKVELRAAPTDEVRITVSDNGPGISEDRLDNIFKPFAQDRTSAMVAHGGGAGVGLSIVDAFMKAHEGSLHIKSHEGFGTNVYLTFPAWRTRRQANENPDDFVLEAG